MTTEVEKITDRIVEQDVIYCVSMMVHKIASKYEVAQKLEIPEDEIMSIMEKPDFDEAPDGYNTTKDEEGYWAFCKLDWGDGDCPDYAHDTELEAIKAAWEDSGEEPPMREALEHWVVSEWLADKLEEEDEMVCRDFLGLTIWGRTTSGQAISMDYVIHKIAEKLHAKHS